MFRSWTKKFVRGVPGDEQASQQVRGEAGMALYQYFGDAIAERRSWRQDEITSALIEAVYDGNGPLTEDEILDVIFTFIIASWDGDQ